MHLRGTEDGAAAALHHISNETELVHDFPWWQMISCLICASSILLIASAFVVVPPGGNEDVPFDALSLAEDAETCLKVFDALGRNSDAARTARDMMQKLRDQSMALRGHRLKSKPSSFTNVCIQDQGLSGSNPAPPSVAIPTAAVEPLQSTPSLEAMAASTLDETTMYSQQDGFNFEAIIGAEEWPVEISDSMAWSVQFFPAMHGLHHLPQ